MAQITEIVAIDVKPYTESDLCFIKNSIETMSKFNHIEVLRILVSVNETINENKYGIHVNLSDLNRNTLDKLMRYIDYVNGQESTLSLVEKQKEEYKRKYFPTE